MSDSLRLKSIAEEAAACRAAWAADPEATHGVHLYHEWVCSSARDIKERISHILRVRPKHERALRLRLVRPARAEDVVAYDAAVAIAKAACDASLAIARVEYATAKATAEAAYVANVATAHALVCHTPGCPFDGRTIFSEVVSHGLVGCGEGGPDKTQEEKR